VSACRHCGAPLPAGAAGPFCCPGCAGAYALIERAGLGAYYARRRLDPRLAPPRPAADPLPPGTFDDAPPPGADGLCRLTVLVEGLQCGACVWLIESLLADDPAVAAARVNLTTRRLSLSFRPGEGDAGRILAPVAAAGYRLIPFDPEVLEDADAREMRRLIRAMAVAGFAAGNVMLLSVSVWAGEGQGMGPATRALMHWLSALVALPSVAYAIRPFAGAAWAGLRAGRATMDLPITIGVFATCLMSLWETAQGGAHAYFDSAVSLLFFLLVGRTLDHRARGRARALAGDLLSLEARAVRVIGADGRHRLVAPRRVAVGAEVLVAAGERIGVDGTVTDGRSEIDTALVSGESLPAPVGPGDRVLAGTLNLAAPVRLRVDAVGEATLLAEIARLADLAGQGRARFVRLAERVARWYAPVVHLAALATFAGWVTWGGLAWQPALLIAVSVLIITCPCALGLAVPVVQVVAAGRLMRHGVLLKSASALERLAQVDHVVFDKTGTLTEGRPALQPDGGWDQADLACAAGLALASAHPLARALVLAAPEAVAAPGVVEHPGDGVAQPRSGLRLGRAPFVGVVEDAAAGGPPGPTLWLGGGGRPPVCFVFRDAPRADAGPTLAGLAARGLPVEILSGDRAPVVAALAANLGVTAWRAETRPAGKLARLGALAAAGRRVLMVGDGLNDAPALDAAHVSIAPARAADLVRARADLVIEGGRLAPVLAALDQARLAQRRVRQNIALALGYNLLAVPLAVAGLVTPLIAAAAMSASSLLVILNAVRAPGKERSWTSS